MLVKQHLLMALFMGSILLMKDAFVLLTWCETSVFSQDVAVLIEDLRRAVSTFYITTKPGVTFS